MGKRIIHAVALAALAVLAVSCAAHLPRYDPDASNPYYTVAVLPVYNVTNDVGGAEAVREEVHRRVAHMHYMALPLKQTDELLMNKMGITLGDQLEMTDPAALGDLLGVDALVYGYVLDFDDITAGVYNVKKVRAAFKLVDARTGMTVWAAGRGVKTVISGGGGAGAGASVLKEILDKDFTPETITALADVPGLGDWHYVIVGGTKKIEDAAAIALGEKILTKALGVHLWLETNKMFDLVMRDFPVGPGRPVHE